MAKARTKTPAIGHNLVPQTRDAAVAQVARIGVIGRELTRRKTDLNDALARIKEQAEEASEPLRQEAKDLTAGLQAWADANRAVLTDNGRVKSADLGTGIIRWALRRGSVRGVPKDDPASLIERIKALGLLQFIRTKEEVNKEAMLADPEAAEGIAGIKVKAEGEEFVVEPFEVQLQGAG